MTKKNFIKYAQEMHEKSCTRGCDGCLFAQYDGNDTYSCGMHDMAPQAKINYVKLYKQMNHPGVIDYLKNLVKVIPPVSYGKSVWDEK